MRARNIKDSLPYVPVVDFTAVRFAPAFAIDKCYVMHWMDMRTALLYLLVDIDVYITLLKGYEVSRNLDQVIKLHRGLYGLNKTYTLLHKKWNDEMRI